MILKWSMNLFTVAAAVMIPAGAQADVVVRAPFVRVQTGGPGTYVRAPFVNIFVPSSRPVYVVPPGPVFVAPPPKPVDVPPMPPANGKKKTKADPDLAPPQPVQPVEAPTLEQFAKSFQPKSGHYEVTILNPATKQPTTVRFSLPEGTPRRVVLNRQRLEFEYGPRQFVRIEFDRDGVVVTTR